MAESPQIETRTFDQLSPATAVSPDALTAIQEPGGPVVKVSIKQLLGRLISTDAAFEEEAEPDGIQGDLDHDENSIGLVYADPAPAKNGWYRKVGASGDGSWHQFEKLSAEAAAEVQALVDAAGAEADRAEAAADVLGSKIGPGRNLADPTLFTPAMRIATAGNTIVTSTVYRSIAFIEVEVGKAYTISGIKNGMRAGFVPLPELGQTATGIGSFSTAVGSLTLTATNPWMIVELTNDGTGVTTYDNTVQVEAGAQATDYETFRIVVQLDEVERGPDLRAAADVARDDAVIPRMVMMTGKNRIDPAAVNFARRYSVAAQMMVDADANPIAASDWIAVEEDSFYIVHGLGMNSPSNPQGGYFAAYGVTNAVGNIIWGDPPTGGGKVFFVPPGVTHVVLNLASDDHVTLRGPVQMEPGEVATAWEPFISSLKIPPQYIPGGTGGSEGGGGGSVAINAAAWFTFVEGEAQPHNLAKWPLFRRHMLAKDKDVCVVAPGTSLTARSTEHHSSHPQAKYRPPLLHSLNLASHIWDRLIWPGQKYARYDAAEFVTEASGSWATSHNLAEWDDGERRYGLTRYSASNGASVSFTIPAGAWAWRFIHRTDSVASEDIAVAIDGGDGLVEVWDEGGSAWIEANGYSFSQREAAPVTRSISVPNPDTDVFASMTIASKGNTTYQKRLKFRVLDRDDDIEISFTNADSGTRFNYWGAEWSPRQYMVTFVNAARGGHNTSATGGTGLPRFADNEVHGFRPDLIFGEIAIHNDGAAGITIYPTHDRWGRMVNNYAFRADYELSLLTRADHFGYTPEIGFWTPTIAWNFGGIGDDGQLLTSTMGDGTVMTALDKFDQAAAWMVQNKPDVVFINAVRRWVDAAVAIYGDLRTATETTGKVGPGMTNDGSHPNDIGSRILAKAIVGALDFVP